MKDVECYKCKNKMVEVCSSYEAQYCCGGGFMSQCGCGGTPTNPVFCETCENELFGNGWSEIE